MLGRIIILLFIAVMPLAAADPFTIVGSDLLKPALAPVLDAAPKATRPIVARLEGSRGAMVELRSGKADIGLVAFTPGEALPEQEFRLLPLGYQVVVFAVSAANPLHQVSFGQLGGLFGEREAVSYRQWGNLGATGTWEEKAIVLNAVDEPGLLAMELFRHMVLKTPQLKSTIAMLPDVKELFNQVRSDETCIGMSPRLPPAGVPATLLQVSRSDKDVAFSPTVENIHTGDYPLRMSFYIACRPDRLGELGTVVALLLGDESAAGLEKAGFVPVPAKNRSELCRVFGGK